MEIANSIVWFGNSRDRFLARAEERQAWGNYNGNKDLGRRLIQEVQDKIKEISSNLNLYAERDNNERVTPLSSSGYTLIYKKDYYINPDGTKQVRLLIIDIRKNY